MWEFGQSGSWAIQCYNGLMDSEQYAAHVASLKPGTFWIDDLPEPLETVADVRDLFERVEVLRASRIAKIERMDGYYKRDLFTP
jgi:hypothetical protein